MSVPAPTLVFGSAVTGAVLWTSMVLAVGDPFDSIAYPVLLLIAGVATAWLNSYRTWRWAASIFIDEFLAYITLVNVGFGGPLWAVGILFLLYYAMIPWIGAKVFAFIR